MSIMGTGTLSYKTNRKPHNLFLDIPHHHYRIHTAPFVTSSCLKYTQHLQISPFPVTSRVMVRRVSRD